MMPIGPLMVEHRVIEKILELMRRQSVQIEKTKSVESGFIEVVVDFFRIYADRCHHGKEEDILFRELGKKKLTSDHQKMMQQLIEEHVYARKTVTKLENANEKCVKEDSQAIDVSKILTELVNFYPVHIEKEDKQFFFPCMEYFKEQEQEDMLQEFWNFDRKMIHEKYRNLVKNLERKESRDT